VCQIGSPHRIATLLQRVGRSGHTIKGLPKGRVFPTTRDDFVECGERQSGLPMTQNIAENGRHVFMTDGRRGVSDPASIRGVQHFRRLRRTMRRRRLVAPTVSPGAPPTAPIAPLATALSQLARNTSDDFGGICSAECPAANLITNPTVATHVYRIAREAVHNAVVLEHVIKLAGETHRLLASSKAMQQALRNKHFFRKHGPAAYYGQSPSTKPVRSRPTTNKPKNPTEPYAKSLPLAPNASC
jgi:hypothetical protein